MNRITRICLTVGGLVALAVVWAGTAAAGSPAADRALMIRSEALNRLHGEQGDVFVPGVTDFPARPAINTVTVSVPQAGGFDWSDAGIGAGSAAFVALLAVAAVAVLRRRSSGILGTASA